jgi:hypothetical protein
MITSAIAVNRVEKYSQLRRMQRRKGAKQMTIEWKPEGSTQRSLSSWLPTIVVMVFVVVVPTMPVTAVIEEAGLKREYPG